MFPDKQIKHNLYRFSRFRNQKTITCSLLIFQLWFKILYSLYRSV